MLLKRLLYLLPGILMLVLPVAVRAQDESSIESRRADIISWMEQYVGNELLLNPEDLKSLIEQVRKMPDDQFEKWYMATDELRKILQSEEWAQTDAWLRDFVRVQSIYSDDEIRDFRSQVAGLTPSQFVQMLERFISKHRSLIAMRQASNRNRQFALNMRDEMVSNTRQAQHTAASRPRNVQSYFAPGSSGPVRSSYAERKNSYRRDFAVWPGGYFWGRW